MNTLDIYCTNSFTNKDNNGMQQATNEKLLITKKTLINSEKCYFEYFELLVENQTIFLNFLGPSQTFSYLFNLAVKKAEWI
jgi:hypothetical protein